MSAMPIKTTTAVVMRAAILCTVAAACLHPTPSQAQDKDTLWTKVSAEDRVISLTWDKSHPWDAVLTARGADLVARYFVDARREVSEPLVSSTLRKGDQRTLRFQLPQALRANPVGPVCLFIQLPDRRALPIRRASDRDADTVGFRYAPWERGVRQVGEVRTAQERVTSAQRALDTSARNLTGQQALLTQRGWSDLASCDQVAAPSAVLGPTPSDVVPPAEQNDVARRICVNRIANGYLVIQGYREDTLPDLVADAAKARDADEARKVMTEAYSVAFAGPDDVTPAALLNGILNSLGGDNATVKARLGQAEAFGRDWNKWVSTLKGYVPQLGRPTEYLGWPSTASESGFRLFGPKLAASVKADWAMQDVPAGTQRDLEAFLGAALDAYSGCVEDSLKQLKTKSDNWEALRSNAPARAASAREFLVRECRQEVGLFEKMKAERTTLQEELTRDQQALAAVSAPAALASKSQDLNQISCAQAQQPQPQQPQQPQRR